MKLDSYNNQQIIPPTLDDEGPTPRPERRPGSLNGQCGKVGGFEGERVFVRLDNSNRVVKVKTINVRKEGGNAAWTRGEAEGGLGGLFGGVMDALGQAPRASRQGRTRIKLRSCASGPSARNGARTASRSTRARAARRSPRRARSCASGPRRADRSSSN